MKTFLLAALFMLGVASPLAAIGVPQQAFAANKGADCEKSILEFHHGIAGLRIWMTSVA